MRIEFLAAPRAVFQRDGRGILLRVAAKGTEAAISRFVCTRARVTWTAHTIGRGGQADPQADLERPVAKTCVATRIPFLPLQLEGANECRRTTQLVEREEAQRITHQDVDTCTPESRIAQAAKHEREGCETEVSFGLAAAGGE